MFEGIAQGAMRIARLTAAALVAICVGVVGATSAGATTAVSTSDDSVIRQVEARFDELGVEEDARAGLLAKIISGELPDSDAGASPVSTQTSTTGDVTITRSVFEDGSVTVSEVPADVAASSSNGIRPLGITGCSSYSNGGQVTRSNCKVAYDALTWSGSYYLTTMGWGPSYTVVRGPYGSVQGGIGVSGKKVTVLNSGGSNATAWVRMEMLQQIKIAGVGVSRDVGFDLKITKTGGPVLTSFGG
jgi:hypothetical protein